MRKPCERGKIVGIAALALPGTYCEHTTGRRAVNRSMLCMMTSSQSTDRRVLITGSARRVGRVIAERHRHCRVGAGRRHQRDIDLARALGDRCWLRARMNVELDKAVSDCKDAIDEDGDQPLYRTYLGWARLRKGDASDARRDFDRSLEKRKQPWGLYGRGLALMKLGETEKGQQDLEAARKLMPTIDETLKRIGFEGLMTASAPAQ